VSGIGDPSGCWLMADSDGLAHEARLLEFRRGTEDLSDYCRSVSSVKLSGASTGMGLLLGYWALFPAAYHCTGSENDSE